MAPDGVTTSDEKSCVCMLPSVGDLHKLYKSNDFFFFAVTTNQNFFRIFLSNFYFHHTSARPIISFNIQPPSSYVRAHIIVEFLFLSPFIFIKLQTQNIIFFTLSTYIDQVVVRINLYNSISLQIHIFIKLYKSIGLHRHFYNHFYPLELESSTYIVRQPVFIYISSESIFYLNKPADSPTSTRPPASNNLLSRLTFDLQELNNLHRHFTTIQVFPSIRGEGKIRLAFLEKKKTNLLRTFLNLHIP